MVPSGAPYFMAEFSTGPSLFARIKQGFFPIQFGRYERESYSLYIYLSFVFFVEKCWHLH